MHSPCSACGEDAIYTLHIPALNQGSGDCVRAISYEIGPTIPVETVQIGARRPKYKQKNAIFLPQERHNFGASAFNQGFCALHIAISVESLCNVSHEITELQIAQYIDFKQNNASSYAICPPRERGDDYFWVVCICGNPSGVGRCCGFHAL